MDYFRNIDKVCDYSDNGLYNTVLSIAFSDEGDEPVTVELAKSWGKIEQDEDDELIEELITAAREVLEGFTGIGFITRTITATINNANGGFQLPYGPVTGDVVVTDSDATWSDLRGEYEVTYTGGHETLPSKFKIAIKAQILFMYENRGESNVALSPFAKMLMEPVRMVV